MNLINTRFLETREAAQQALDLSERYHTPPVPNTFEVWFAYVTRQHSELRREIEEAIDAGTPLTEELLHDIYEKFLSPTAMQGELASIGNGLASEIAHVFSKVESGLVGNNRFAGQLRDSLRELSTSGNKEEVRSIAKQLFQANQAYLTLTHEMGEQLETTRHQLGEMKKELNVLRKSAFTDHLTQLPNRRYLDQFLGKLMDEALKTDTPLCVAIADLDHFKAVNDTWGHATGDNILKRFGRLLTQNLKGQDIAARIGGEEFALVLPNTALSGATSVCETLRATFENIEWVRRASDEHIGSLTVSFGVAQLNPGNTPAQLLERADQMLYSAKGEGRNKVVAAP